MRLWMDAGIVKVPITLQWTDPYQRKDLEGVSVDAEVKVEDVAEGGVVLAVDKDKTKM